MGSRPTKRATPFLPTKILDQLRSHDSFFTHTPPYAKIVSYLGRLAQLVRASVLHTGGQRFKSSTAHHAVKIGAC